MSGGRQILLGGIDDPNVDFSRIFGKPDPVREELRIRKLMPLQELADIVETHAFCADRLSLVTEERDAATAAAKKQLGEIQRHFTAIAGSGEIRVYEDTGEKHGIDYQSSVWAKRGERMTRDLIEFLGEHHRPEPVGNGESK